MRLEIVKKEEKFSFWFVQVSRALLFLFLFSRSLFFLSKKKEENYCFSLMKKQQQQQQLLLKNNCRVIKTRNRFWKHFLFFNFCFSVWIKKLQERERERERTKKKTNCWILSFIYYNKFFFLFLKFSSLFFVCFCNKKYE